MALALLFSPLTPPSWAGPPFAQFIDPHPAPGNQFGATVVALSTGNVVITSPDDDTGGTNAGAVYLFNGATGALISTLMGSSTNEHIGSGGVTALTNGNYVVISPIWGGVGAVTWGNGTSGIVGVVSPSNSLVGGTSNDYVGFGGVTALTNGNYVVKSNYWDGAAADVGAVTWGNGSTGTVGVISASNSLVGSTAGDNVGSGIETALGLTALANGNYVVASPRWDSGAATDVGAVTWGDGTTGTVGVVSAANSLVGSTAGDSVGYRHVTALTNGHYVVGSGAWDNGAVVDAGAATWGNGTTGIVGAVTAANSLVGSTAGDHVGSGFFGVVALTNGGYVVSSPGWDNGAVPNVGAVTQGNGTMGTVGVVSTSNSLVGSTADDRVGSRGVIPLTNGAYVVNSPEWNGAAPDVGATTWRNGTTGTVGVVSASNSLVGSTAGDWVGYGGVTALTNGHYVVGSPYWDGTAPDAGAATWGNGATGAVGVVSASNSLVGSSASDWVGGSNYFPPGGVMALTNGNYVVSSTYWDGTAADSGAVTWGNGTTGTVGVVSASNSLTGSSTSDSVGRVSMFLDAGVTALPNGNYAVGSTYWDGTAPDAGAVTWGNGTSGTAGTVSESNSLVGGVASAGLQKVAFDNVNGTYFARFLNEGGGRVRLGSQVDGIAPTLGAVSASNVTMVSANISGSVLVGSGLAITARGFVYAQTATNSAPTIGGIGVMQIPLGTGTGAISTTLSGLTSLQGYSFRAYATNTAGTAYSVTGTFTTGAPTVADPTSSGITGTTATLGGDVVADQGLPITERGVVYSLSATNASPLIGGTGVTKAPVIGGLGLFATGVTGLSPGTGYSFRAFATNAAGTGYTSVATFATTCPSITLASLPNGNAGLAYGGSAAASGGTGPYTYSITSGVLPDGLSLTASGAGAGSITGTPGTTGTFTFDIMATDNSGVGTCTGVRSYSVVIDPNSPTDFFTLTPCRLFDTRNAVDPLGGPALEALVDRTFVVAGTCGIPADAKAISVNLAVTQPTNPGNLRLHTGGTAVPFVSSINFKAGQTRSNNGVIPLSALGELAAYLDQAAGTAHLILDVNGYFK